MRTLILVTLLCALTPIASAQQAFTPTQSFYLDLDSDAGRFSQWTAEVPCGVNGVRAQLRAPRLGQHAQYLPGINLIVGRGQQEVSVRFSAYQGSSLFTAELLAHEAQTDIATVDLAQPTAVEMSWTEEGVVTFAIGGVRRTASLSGAPQWIRLANSTGEATFNDLQLGYMGAAPRCP